MFKKAIENVFAAIRHAHAKAFADAVCGVGVQHASGADLRHAAQESDGNRRAKYPGVMVIHLVFKRRGTFLARAL